MSTAEKTTNAAATAEAEERASELGIEVGEAPFSLELSDDQRDIQEWVHGFAEQTVRPAAHEWDEKEEFPWPIVQEAAKIGLYGFEGIAQFWADPSGLTFPIVNEELFWGDAGIGMSIFGTTLAVAGIFASGTTSSSASGCRSASGPSTSPRWLRSAPPSPTRAPTSRQLRTTAKYDEGKRRMGLQRAEGLGDQRWHRRRPRGDRLCRSRARRPRPCCDS